MLPTKFDDYPFLRKMEILDSMQTKATDEWVITHLKETRVRVIAHENLREIVQSLIEIGQDWKDTQLFFNNAIMEVYMEHLATKTTTQ